MLYALMAIDSSIVRYYEIVATWNKHKNTPTYQRKLPHNGVQLIINLKYYFAFK